MDVLQLIGQVFKRRKLLSNRAVKFANDGVKLLEISSGQCAELFLNASIMFGQDTVENLSPRLCQRQVIGTPFPSAGDQVACFETFEVLCDITLGDQ